MPHRRVVHVQVAADRADHDLTGIQPDPNLEGHTLGALDLSGILFDRRLHGERRIARPHRLVFMRDRRPKQRHDAVAHHLVHRPLIAVHGLHHAFEHGVENRPCIFGVAVG